MTARIDLPGYLLLAVCSWGLLVGLPLGCVSCAGSQAPALDCHGKSRADLSAAFLREAGPIVASGACTAFDDVEQCPALQPAIQRHEAARKEYRQCQ